MTDDLSLVVVPYERFLERRERRRRVTDELGRREESPLQALAVEPAADVKPPDAGTRIATPHDGPVLPRGMGQRKS